jgi:hypothetical protein
MNQSASRRTFLKVAGSSLLAGGLAPAILGAEDKAGTKPAIIGEGEFQFRCHHNWGDVPAGITWRNTHGVTVNREGFVFIKHQGHQNRPCDTIAVFDPQGKFVRSFGTEYAGGGHGIDIREEDGTEFLYLCDTFHRQVVKCDTEGEWVWKKRYPREPGVYGQLQQFRPTNVCFGPQGTCTWETVTGPDTSISTMPQAGGSVPGADRARNRARCGLRTGNGWMTARKVSRAW